MSFVSSIFLVLTTFIVATIFDDSVEIIIVLHVLAALAMVFSGAIDVRDYIKQKGILEERPQKENRFLE